MTKLRELYYCSICGNVVEIVHRGASALVCCGQPMELLNEKRADSGREKHVPVKEVVAGELLVKVGDIAHPMMDKHYIQFIEVMTVERVLRVELLPNQAPQALFKVNPQNVTGVRAYCNLHGVWQA